MSPNKTPTKEQEEFLQQFENDLIELDSMSIYLPEFETTLTYDKNMDNLPKKLHFVLPEYSIYILTLKYKIIKKPLKNVSYKQVVRRAGIPFQTRVCPIADEATVNDEQNKLHSVTFDKDDLPGGIVVRATYKSTSSILVEGASILDVPWILEISKKGTQPRLEGYE